MTTVAALILVIRVFDRSGVLPADRTAALRTADAILRQADVATTWVDCSSGSPAASLAACLDPLAAGELAVRITRAPAHEPASGRLSLGYSLLEHGSGSLATVFSDRVARLADASRARRPTLLGRAIAHEIGHLLIGSAEHATTGLMRAEWTVADIVRNRRDDWLFSTSDAVRLRKSRPPATGPTRLAETVDAAAPAS